MKRVYELDVYTLSENLSDIYQQHKSMKAEFLISIFQFWQNTCS